MSKTSGDISVAQILKTWVPFSDSVGGVGVHTRADYKRVGKIVDSLVDIVREDETHALAPVLDYLAFQLEMYEAENGTIPDAEPREVLRLLMEEHGLRQSDFGDEIPQGRISDVLSGRRKISKAMAKVFAKRFRVSAEAFL